MLNIKQRIGIFLPLILMLCGSSVINNEDKLPSQNGIQKTFAALQSQYFQQINLSASPQRVNNIPGFSAKLTKLADLQRAQLIAHPDLSPTDKALAGLIFIYDALLILDGYEAITLGKLSLADFKRVHHFAKPGSADKVELAARVNYALSELKAAAKLRPDDRRIDGWIQGAQSILERIETGKISAQTQTAVLNAIPVRPTFNLWTALIILHDEDASSLGELAAAAKNFVDASSDKKTDPCKKYPQDCLSGPKAPYNFQGAIVELGDIFLRRAEYYLQKGDIQNAMIMAQYAEGTYAQLDLPANKALTEKWPARDIIALRKNRLAQVMNKQVPKGPLVNQEQYQRAYQCGSCHSK